MNDAPETKPTAPARTWVDTLSAMIWLARRQVTRYRLKRFRSSRPEPTVPTTETGNELSAVEADIARLSAGLPRWARHPLPILAALILAGLVAESKCSDGSSAVSSGEAHAWADSYFDATPLAAEDFLRRLRTVRLAVMPNGELESQVGAKKLEQTITAALAKHGIRVDPTATVTCELHGELLYTVRKVTDTQDGSVVSSDKISQLYTRVDFSVQTACLREGRMVPLTVYPLPSFEFAGGPGRSDGEVMQQQMGKDIESILTKYSTPPDGPVTTPELDRAWRGLRWDRSQDAAMCVAWRDAARQPPGPGQRTFAGIRDVQQPYLSLGNDSTDLGQAETYRQQWEAGFRASRITTGRDAPVKIAHDLNAVKGTTDTLQSFLGLWNPATVYYRAVSCICVYESNVVYMFDGRMTRGMCVIWEDHRTGRAMKNDAADAVHGLATQNIEEFFKQFDYRR